MDFGKGFPLLAAGSSCNQFGMNGKAGGDGRKSGVQGERKSGGDELQKNSPTGKLVRAYRQSYQIQYSALKKGCQSLFRAIPHFPEIA